eukprot:6258784-Prymnesium_polylepis.1
MPTRRLTRTLDRPASCLFLRRASARVGGVQEMCKRIFRPGEWQKIVPQIRGVFLNYDPLSHLKVPVNDHLQCAIG